MPILTKDKGRADVIFGDIADGLTRGAERASDAVSEAFFEPALRIGVTGLSRAGKTVFITSLVANLLDRARLPGLTAAAQGRILAAYLQPQPDDTVPRFDYETHLAALTGSAPTWPESTRAVSQLRLSLRVKPGGLLAGFQRPRTIHLDIVDYPGEWLLDLELLDKTYETWAAQTLERLATRPQAAPFRDVLATIDAGARLEGQPCPRCDLASAAAGWRHGAGAHHAVGVGHVDVTDAPERLRLSRHQHGHPHRRHGAGAQPAADAAAGERDLRPVGELARAAGWR